MDDSNNDPDTIRHELNKLFAYKAEWLKERIFDLFTAPSYFGELSADVPCVLQGGRGTGKTTVLRGMSYLGKYALSDKKPTTVLNWEQFGFYIRIDTNRVTAFNGPEASQEKWQTLFGHYLNLVLCDLVFEFLEWHEKHTQIILDLDPNLLNRFAKSLQLPDFTDSVSARIALADAIVIFESYVNNIADAPPVSLSMQGAPIDLLIGCIMKTETFSGKRFRFLIDEYENLSSDQQQVVNTLIKHASNNYTFTIGVKELGWRCKTTLNVNERLVSPADYRLINIEEKLSKNFDDFARSVCDARLQVLRTLHKSVPDSIENLFPSLSLNDEALKLGVGVKVTKYEERLEPLNEDIQEFYDSLKPLERYFIFLNAEHEDVSAEDYLSKIFKDTKKWRQRYENYAYSLLFEIKKRKRGIRKFYCGWNVLSLLAGSNIRYLIELVDMSIEQHMQSGMPLSRPISPEIQTQSAVALGKKNLAELEGVSIRGAKLTKLLLGLGRVFGVMAEDALGHAPEVNQFDLPDTQIATEVEDLLSQAVMHLALVRMTGTKNTGFDTKDFDYAIHPSFAPFFVFSHRRKRKMTLNGEDLLILVENASLGIKKILARTHRTDSIAQLPDQLTLFEKYYDDNQ